MVQNAGRRDTVEVLAADGDTSNKGTEVASILADGALQSLELIEKPGVSARSPEGQGGGRVLVEMAAGMAEMGSLAVLDCCYRHHWSARTYL